MSQEGPILVTGATGFIGGYLVERLRKEGQEVFEWTADIREIGGWREQARALVHLAAVSDPDDFRRAPGEAYSVNVLGTLAVMEFCRQAKAACVLASTCGVYKLESSVRQIAEDEVCAPAGPYAVSKLLAEQVAAAYANQHGLSVVVLRLFNVFGNGQGKHFLIPYVLNCLLQDRKPALRTPHAIRDFIYIDDVIEAFCRALAETHNGFRVYNTGTGKGISVVDAVRAVREVFIKKSSEPLAAALEGHTETQQPADVSIADISRSVAELGWQPRYTFEQGLEAMRATRV